MPVTSAQQDLNLQKLYILGTGSAANSTEMASFNSMVSASGGSVSIANAVNQYINSLVATQGVVSTIQAIAKNGFGVTLTNAEAQQTITDLTGAGIDSGYKLLDYLSTLDGNYGGTLNNRAEAASSFLDTLSASDKSANFTGAAVTTAVRNMLQNIDGTSASLANANSGFNALSANLSATGITGTVDHFLSGSIVFADTNNDGMVSPGEWTSLTASNGTFVLPNSVTAKNVIVYGGNDLMTGNAFQGQLSASAGSTVVNPFTTLIQSMVNSGLAGTVLDATNAIKSAFSLPATINLMSYNPLTVLANGSATAAEKSAALKVQVASEQISTVIIHGANVADIVSPGATLQSAAAAVTVALAKAVIDASHSTGGTINLAASTTVEQIMQAAFNETGATITSAQISQIAHVTAANNAAAAAATSITQLAQAADVAQGSATNALIAGANSNNFGSADSGFSGSSLTTAIDAATVGSIAPGVLLPPTAAQNTAADTAAAGAAAAALAAPIATLTYSIDSGASSTTASVRDANTLRIVATFDKAVSDGTPTITINNGILVAVTAMTKTDSTHYFYDLNVPAGDIAAATVTIGGAKDATSNTISAAPNNAVFAVDNTAPSVPTAVTLAPVGGNVVANTLNGTNTNMTATATITAGQATGGSAVLKVGATTIATDSSILAGDTSVTFTLGKTTSAALQAAVTAGGVVTVTLSDKAGNTSVSAVGNPTLAVAYTSPSAPTGLTLTTVGGTVIPNTLNSTNTNLTAVATITAGQATGGSAVLKIGSTTIKTDATILIGDTSVSFDLSTADNAALQAAVAAGGVATVTLIDSSGNQSVSAANPTLAVDYQGQLISLTATINETLSGTAANDIFIGTYGNGAGPYTFHTGDILNGLGGTGDTLYITTGAEASTPPDNLWLSKTNFEKVFLNSIGNGAQVVTTGAAFEAAFATNGVDLSVQTLLGAIDITMTTFTGTANITTTTIGAGAHTITTGSGVSTVNAIAKAAGAQTIDGVGLQTVTANVNAAGDQTIGTTNSGNLTSVTATILGTGAQTIKSTSNSNVTIVANAADGAQTITTAGGNDKVTTTGAVGQSATISTGAGNDTIISGLGSDLITPGTGTDTITGGGGVDTFQFGTDGSLVAAMDIITDFNTSGADVIKFGAGTSVLLTADLTALVAGTNVNTAAGGLISFHASDNTFNLKVAAIQADLQLDAAGSVAMFVDGGNTYVYYAGIAIGNADDQLIQLTGITTLTTMIGGASLTIS